MEYRRVVDYSRGVERFFLLAYSNSNIFSRYDCTPINMRELKSVDGERGGGGTEIIVIKYFFLNVHTGAGNHPHSDMIIIRGKADLSSLSTNKSIKKLLGPIIIHIRQIIERGR